MTLRVKTLIIIVVTLFGLIVLLYASSQTFLFRSFIDLEDTSIKRGLQRGTAAYSSEVDSLQTLATSLATRADSVQFVQQPSDAYIESNLSTAALNANRVNAVIYQDLVGNVIYSKGFSLGEQSEVPVSPSFFAFVESNTLAAPVSGLILLPDDPMLIAAAPIQSGDGAGVVQGTLFIGRYLNHDEVQRMADSYSLFLTVYALADPELPYDFRTAASNLSVESPTYTQPLSTRSIAAYRLLSDINGAPVAILRVDMPRDVYEQGRTSLWYFMIALGSSGIVFGIMIMLLLEQAVLSPLRQLSKNVIVIAQNSDLSARVSMGGHDELSQLAQTVNQMLEALERSQTAIRESEERLRTVVSNAPIVLYSLDERNHFNFLEGRGLGNLDPKQFIGRPLSDVFANLRFDTQDTIRRVFIGTGEIAGLAFEIRHLPIISRNRIIGVIGVATDITERKRAEAAEHEQHMMAEALRDTAAALTSTLKLDEVLDRILTNLGRVVPHDTANIMLLEDGIASVARSQGYSGRGLDVWINMLHLPLAKSPELARMVAANQTLALSWEGWLDAPEMAWVQSCASAPICLDGRVIGLLNLDSSTPNFFTREEIERLRVFAAQAALAIRNAQIYEAERHERLLAQTLQKTAEALATSINLENTLNQIVEQLGLVVHYDRVAIMLVEGDYLHVAGARGFPDIDTMQQNLYHYSDIPQLQQAMTAGVPVVLNDIESNSEWMQFPGFQSETRSWIGMPLIAREVVIGFLSAASNQANAYTRRDAEAVAAFAQQAALAVENARILHEFETSLEHLREAQFQLVRAARLSAAGEIAAGVAHQINNPLTTIFVESHLMLQDLAPEDPMVESAEAIQDAARRAGAAVRRMLDLTRSHAYQMTDLDINHSLQSSLSLIRAQLAPHITRLTVELAPGLPAIEASAEHLEDVWINLLLNARDAVKDQKDGMIRVTSRLHETGNAIVVTIGDNGPGIPADFVGRVFEPFFTTKPDGTGLGLSICHDVVTRHGGAIQVDSGSDRGTMFTITLPVVRD